MSLPPRKLFLAPALLAAALAGCASLIPPDPNEAFVGREAPRFHVYPVLGRKIFAAEIGPQDGPPVLFVHGSPGSWGVAASLMTDPLLAGRVHWIAVDRPGFGRSGAGRLETSLLRQAAMLKKVLEQAAPGRKAIVAGHSLGGPVAARLAMDAPSTVRGLVLVAGAVDPAQERTTWYQKVARWRWVRAILPKRFNVANDEIRPLKRELERMLPLWRKIRSPVEIIQGDADALVAPENADFAVRMLTGTDVHLTRVPDQGHRIPTERPDLIRDAVVRLLEGER